MLSFSSKAFLKLLGLEGSSPLEIDAPSFVFKMGELETPPSRSISSMIFRFLVFLLVLDSYENLKNKKDSIL
ncbi:unnamed protein product, partial [Linum tenue]